MSAIALPVSIVAIPTITRPVTPFVTPFVTASRRGVTSLRSIWIPRTCGGDRVVDAGGGVVDALLATFAARGRGEVSVGQGAVHRDGVAGEAANQVLFFNF